MRGGHLGRSRWSGSTDVGLRGRWRAIREMRMGGGWHLGRRGEKRKEVRIWLGKERKTKYGRGNGSKLTRLGLDGIGFAVCDGVPEAPDAKLGQAEFDGEIRFLVGFESLVVEALRQVEILVDT